MTAKKDEIIVKPQQAIEGVPDYLKEEVGMLGVEGMERGDITLPRLGLCQSQTPQRKRTDSKYIDGLEEGDYFNTITGERYGNRVFVVPLLFYKTRIRFTPIEQGGGIVCQARDFKTGVGDPGGNCETCPMAQFINNVRPSCNKFFNYPAIAWAPEERPGPGGLLVVSFKSTGLKVASAWNSLMSIRRKSMFTGVYEFTSATQKNQTGQEWFTPVVRNAGWVPEATLSLVKQMFDSVNQAQQEGRLREDLEQPPHDEHTQTEL